MERLDKLLSGQGLGTRSTVREMIRSGRVCVNGIPCQDPGRKTDPARDEVRLDEAPVCLVKTRYGMMNKPPGILTAASDRKARTVMDLLPPVYRAMGLMPVGRLDKDARGLLLFTNDGALAHFLLSPRRHVDKTYRVVVDGPLNEADVSAFQAGLFLGDFTAQPAQLCILSSGDLESLAEVILREGKFHQVKRMFLARGRTVVDLQRVRLGSVVLDESLPEGMFRELTHEEAAALAQDALGEEGNRA